MGLRYGDRIKKESRELSESPVTRHHSTVQPSSSIPPLSQPYPSLSPYRSTNQSPIPVTSPLSSQPQNFSLGGVPKISIYMRWIANKQIAMLIMLSA